MNIWLAVAGLVIVAFGGAAFFGAPYVPTKRRQINQALDLLNLKPGQTVLDLGSGDGSFLLVAAQRGIKGIGYEINPWLVLVSRLRSWPYRKLVSIKLANFWALPLPAVDGMYVFLIRHYVPKLVKKLESEIKQPLKLVSYEFELTKVKPIKQVGRLFLYQL